MNGITSFIKRHPQVTFWALAWSTWSLGWYLASKYPSDLWYLFIYGPFLIGLGVTAIADGRPGVRTYFSRMVRWRVRIRWYAIALFLPLVLNLAAAGLNILTGASISPAFQMPTWSALIAAFVFPSLLLIALGEEPGFRGFALPRLLVGRSALLAALILGVLHAIWHIPLMVFAGDPPLVALIVISGSLLNTWLFNNTKGSVLLAMLLHASVDAMTGIFGPMFAGAEAESQFMWETVVFVVMAIILSVLAGPELGRKPGPALAAAAPEAPVVVK